MAASVDGRRWSVAEDSQRSTDILTLAFHGVLGRFHIRGLNDVSRRRLYARYLPDGVSPVEAVAAEPEIIDEFNDLVELLLDHRSGDSEEIEWLACAMASSCTGNDHLWQDMGLPNRAVLSKLLRKYFTTLFEKNTGNMKWKKFLYKQLCERMEINICKAPTCQACTDYSICFGPEEG